MNPNDVAKWQKKFKLDYHVPYALACEEAVGIRGKRVLEVGGSLPEGFVLGALGAKAWLALEETDYYAAAAFAEPRLAGAKALAKVARGDGYRIARGRIEDLPPKFFGQFDLVFSIAAFEHLLRLPQALVSMHQALRPGGKLFAIFSPVWSSVAGHHLHGVKDKQGRVFDFRSSPIPPWGHLLMTPPALHRHLLAHTDPDTAAEIVYHVYHAPSINRLFTEDYVDHFGQSPFKVESLEGVFPAAVPPATLAELKRLHPGRGHFANTGIKAILAK